MSTKPRVTSGLLWRCIACVTVAVTAMVLGAGSGAAQPIPEPLPSQDPFYTYDGPLADFAPGTILRSRPSPQDQPPTEKPRRRLRTYVED